MKIIIWVGCCYAFAVGVFVGLVYLGQQWLIEKSSVELDDPNNGYKDETHS